MFLGGYYLEIVYVICIYEILPGDGRHSVSHDSVKGFFLWRWLELCFSLSFDFVKSFCLELEVNETLSLAIWLKDLVLEVVDTPFLAITLTKFRAKANADTLFLAYCKDVLSSGG